MDIKLVGVDSALHHCLAQTIAGGDKDHLIEAGLRVNGEHHPGGPQIRSHHPLNACAQGHVLVRKTFVHTVADGPVVIERSEHFADFVQDVVDPCHVQKRFLLTGKRGVWQVFRRGRGPHSK